ncbi:hypothetical protein WR25_23963 [Diploscapter pachys]|uniref:Transmembrane protein n=1 Tax=Diploscapter pachys TaxID=2018661 RepID=A0A2A2LAE9_9BILA|nr:hypothetical protein WR25_23963 [Diploscapter pachys]
MIPMDTRLNIVLSLLQFIFASLNFYFVVLHICLLLMTMPQSFFAATLNADFDTLQEVPVDALLEETN